LPFLHIFHIFSQFSSVFSIFWKASWIVKRYGKYRRNPSWIVKWY
jgi:hypothetical protein